MSSLENIQNIRDFMWGGQAEFTLHSLETDKHFTYRIINHGFNPSQNIRFMFFLSGSDNDNDWSYLGTMKKIDGKLYPRLTKKSPAYDAPVVKALFWFNWYMNMKGIKSDQIEFMHSGKCSACGRKLTTPESIAIGMGPVCRSRM